MELINKILENNVIFYSIIGGLVLLFIIIIYFAFFYNKKDKEEIKEVKEVKKVKQETEDINDIFDIEEDKEKEEAKEELQRVIDQMTQDVQNKKEDNIETFESLQEENAVISYQELVNNVKSEKMEFNLEDVYEEDALEEIRRQEQKNNEDINSFFEEENDYNKEESINSLFNENDNLEKIEIKEENINKYYEDDNKNLNSLFEEENINNLFEEEDKEEEKINASFSRLINKEEINEEEIMEEVKPKRYKKSEIISPIYGRQNIDIEYPKIETFDRNREFRDTLIDIEEELKEKPLTDEDSKNEEFLKTLKEFRRNL